MSEQVECCLCGTRLLIIGNNIDVYEDYYCTDCKEYK